MSLTQFKAEASQQIKELRNSSEPLILTQNGCASVVVEDYTQYQRNQRALALLRLIALGEADISHNRQASQHEVFSQLKARLEEEQEHG